MLFGLFNRLVSFQHYINDTIQKYLNNFYIVYFDNILIFNKNELEYELYVKKVLNRLQDVELQVDITKSQFHIFKVVYLRLIFTICGI